MYSLLQRVRDEGQNLLVLVQQQHNSEVSQTFVGETRTGYKLEAFDLAKMRGIAQHMDVKQLRDVVMSSERVFLFEGCPNRGRLILYEGSLIR